MSRTLAIADTITLQTLRDQVGLTRTTDPNFFTEWQAPAIELTDSDRQLIQRLSDRYDYYFESALIQEEAVKMILMSPLLEGIGFFDPPFRTEFEKSVTLTFDDLDDTTYRGRIDTLVILDTLWILSIESKHMRFSVENGLAQLLAYTLTTPHPDRPTFGLVTNGTDFLFAKVQQTDADGWQYSLSRKFSMQTVGDLAEVMRVLYRIKAIA